MKKIMIAFAIAFCAILGNAATVNWNSGTLRPALDSAGGWAAKGGVKANLADGAELMVSLFLVDEATYTAAEKMSSLALYTEYASKSGAVTEGYVANNITVSTSAEVGQSYYAVLLYSYTDATYGEMILATTAKIDGSAITNAANTYNVANIGSTAGAANGGWSAVPEPTGAMLIVLGVAALALRRKQR